MLARDIKSLWTRNVVGYLGGFELVGIARHIWSLWIRNVVGLLVREIQTGRR